GRRAERTAVPRVARAVRGCTIAERAVAERAITSRPIVYPRVRTVVARVRNSSRAVTCRAHLPHSAMATAGAAISLVHAKIDALQAALRKPFAAPAADERVAPAPECEHRDRQRDAPAHPSDRSSQLHRPPPSLAGAGSVGRASVCTTS